MTIYEYLKENHTGKENAISYMKLRDMLWANDIVWLDKKDEVRFEVAQAFIAKEEKVIGGRRGVYVAANKEEIEEYCDYLFAKAMGFLRHYSKLKKLPQDHQMLIDFESGELKEVER